VRLAAEAHAAADDPRAAREALLPDVVREGGDRQRAPASSTRVRRSSLKAPSSVTERSSPRQAAKWWSTRRCM
jgi:hypothetical protein